MTRVCFTYSIKILTATAQQFINNAWCKVTFMRASKWSFKLVAAVTHKIISCFIKILAGYMDILAIRFRWHRK